MKGLYMCAFIYYSGPKRYREKDMELLQKGMLKLLSYGGMMQFNTVSVYGKEILLIHPPVPNKENQLIFRYNYFEDDYWEDVRCDMTTMRFRSKDVGYNEFNDVVTAAHTLCELYDQGYGFTEINDNPTKSERYAGWINHLLGTHFSMSKRLDLWEEFEHAVERDQIYKDYPLENTLNHVLDAVPLSLRSCMLIEELADIYYAVNGTKDLEEHNPPAGSYSAMVKKCRQSMERYLETGSSPDNLRTVLYSLLKKPREKREQTAKENVTLTEIASLSLELPARVFVYLFVELSGRDFWAEWTAIRETVYHDEEMKQYMPDNILQRRNELLKRPVPDVSTSEFLNQTYEFCFTGSVPKELENEPRYYLSDDDRAYWWDDSDEVVLSGNMEGWLKSLAEQHKTIRASLSVENLAGNDFLTEMMDTLADADNTYERIFAFSNMFYEFLQNAANPDYVAAMRLFRKLLYSNREQGILIKQIKDDWYYANRKLKFNHARLMIKRYLAVMANPKLRKKFFGF